MAFQRAVKHDAKLRMTINGPAGSGKTFTALLFASELGRRVAVVDTEHGSASKYADLWQFDVLELDSFHPQHYIDAIHDAEQAGYDVIVLDSLSHAWMGTDGLLDEVDKIAKRNRNTNTFAAWKDATPIQNKLVDTIIGARLHVIATMRTKQDYIIQEDEKGRKVPKMVGMAPVQREGMEYEFDIVAEMDNDNVMRIVKTRCPALSGGIFKKPSADVVATIKAWLFGSGPAPKAKPRDTETPAPDDAPAPARVKPQAESQAKKTASRQGMMNRLNALLVEAQELFGGDRYNPFHLQRHLEKYYNVQSMDALTDEQVIAFGKHVAGEVEELRATMEAEVGGSESEPESENPHAMPADL